MGCTLTSWSCAKTTGLCVSTGKEAKEMTEEMMLKKTEKNRKRRLAAQRRKERRKVCVSLRCPGR